MAYIPLIEHSRPRVMMLDFSPQDVAKFEQAGFEVRRGATGLHNRDEFCIPFAIQDVEVLFAQVKNGSFISEDRAASADSVEENPFFRDMMREIWKKAGWTVLFISQNTAHAELEAIGLERLGVIAHARSHVPESIRKSYLEYLDENRPYRNVPEVNFPPPQMPRFVGHGVYQSDDLEASIIQRYIKSARMSFLTCLNSLRIPTSTQRYK